MSARYVDQPSWSKQFAIVAFGLFDILFETFQNVQEITIIGLSNTPNGRIYGKKFERFVHICVLTVNSKHTWSQ